MRTGRAAPVLVQALVQALVPVFAVGLSACDERAASQPAQGAMATQAERRHVARVQTERRQGEPATRAEPGEAVSGTSPARERTDTPPTGPGAQMPTAVRALMALAGARSTSVGAADDGTLAGGVELPKRGPGFRHNDRRPDAARWGTVELVQALVAAAGELPPGPPLMINDLGLQQGGPIAQHGSHQAGRDVDILFFYRDTDGNPHPPIGVPVEPDGTGVDYRDLSDPADDIPLRFDGARTWRFCQALVEAAFDDIQRIFIVEHVREMLLKEARRAGAPTRILERFAQVTCQPGTPHDDHMHVRFYCTPEDMARGCLDKAPTYPWRRDALAALDLEPALYRGRPSASKRKARAARTTTAQQAKKRAVRRYGKLHREVKAFLKRRKTWQRKKTPPRPFCR